MKMEPRTLFLRATSIGAVVLLVDQSLKLVARQSLAACSGPPVSACERLGLGGPFGLLRLENAGSALGFFQGMSVWAVIAVLGLALIPLYGRRVAQTGWLAAIAIGLQAGGTLGNLVDRAVFGSVTDFIDVGVGVVFNPADVALLCGMVLAFEAVRRSGFESSSPNAVLPRATIASGDVLSP
jgi:signal peptidase II